MSKQSYYERLPLSEVDSAIELLCSEYGCCTPTDVLRLLKYEENKFSRSCVVERAMFLEYTVVNAGKGMRIEDCIEC